MFTQYYGSTALDASLLLAVLVRFLPPDDPRIRATVLAIADELTEDGLVLRYRTEETDDGFTGEEGSFTICSFWLVSALCEIGEYDRARKLCAKLLSFAGPLELYAEEIDAAHRPAPGQLPAGVHPPGADQRRAARDRDGRTQRRDAVRAGGPLTSQRVASSTSRSATSSGRLAAGLWSLGHSRRSSTRSAMTRCSSGATVRSCVQTT